MTEKLVFGHPGISPRRHCERSPCAGRKSPDGSLPDQSRTASPRRHGVWPACPDRYRDQSFPGAPESWRVAASGPPSERQRASQTPAASLLETFWRLSGSSASPDESDYTPDNPHGHVTNADVSCTGRKAVPCGLCQVFAVPVMVSVTVTSTCTSVRPPA